MITEEIRAVLAAKASALLRRSADDMAALLHPDFVYVNAGGYRLNKAEYIDVGCTSGKAGVPQPEGERARGPTIRRLRRGDHDPG